MATLTSIRRCCTSQMETGIGRSRGSTCTNKSGASGQGPVGEILCSCAISLFDNPLHWRSDGPAVRVESGIGRLGQIAFMDGMGRADERPVSDGGRGGD